MNLTPHQQKLLQKKALAPVEVTIVWEILSQTPEGLVMASRHSCSAIRRKALHALHAQAMARAEARNIDVEGMPELFRMPEEHWIPLGA